MARIGPYELIERVGIGGMAEVFKALQPGEEGFERVIAVKRILPSISADAEFVKMFIDEAKIAVQLQHPNIAQIYDLGRDGDDLYIALEYVPGRDMSAVTERQAKSGRLLPLSFVVYAVTKICEALQYAHFASAPGGKPLNFIHRDISPQNILVSTEGAVKVIDFGLAKAAGRLVSTQSGVVKGKLAYLSSEQARGEDIDHRSDIFSLGTCFYEWLTGKRLFFRKNDMETVMAVQKAEVPPLRAVRPELPSALQNIVLRALAANPNDRFASAQEMQEELMAFAFDAGMGVRRRAISDVMRQLFPEDAVSASDAVPADLPRRATVPSPMVNNPVRTVESGVDEFDEWTTMNREIESVPPHPDPLDDVSAVPIVDDAPSLYEELSAAAGRIPTPLPSVDDLTTGDFSLRAVEIASAKRGAPSRYDSFEEPTMPYPRDMMDEVLAEAIAVKVPSDKSDTFRPPSFDDETRTSNSAAVALAFEDETSDGARRAESPLDIMFEDVTRVADEYDVELIDSVPPPADHGLQFEDDTSVPSFRGPNAALGLRFDDETSGSESNDVIASFQPHPTAPQREAPSFDDETRAAGYDSLGLGAELDPLDEETSDLEVDVEELDADGLPFDPTRTASKSNPGFEDETADVSAIGLEDFDGTVDELVDDFDDLTIFEPIKGEKTNPG